MKQSHEGEAAERTKKKKKGRAKAHPYWMSSL
jgi:hypothetical protein